jgi:hypothetical protein
MSSAAESWREHCRYGVVQPCMRLHDRRLCRRATRQERPCHRTARQEVIPQALEPLRSRHLVEVSGDGPAAIFRLTPAGREIALECITESKAMGATFLDRLGYWNAGAFKNLLKQFIVETDIDLPHPWEGAKLDEQGVV